MLSASAWKAGWSLLAFGSLCIYFLFTKRKPRKRLPVSAPCPDHLQPWEEVPVAKTLVAPRKWLSVHTAWLTWWRECGQLGLFRTPPFYPLPNTVIVTDPALVGPLYTKLPKDVSYNRFHYMMAPHGKLGEGVFSSTHEDRTWRATRKYIAPFFSLPNLRSKVPILNEKALLLCQKLRGFGPNPVETQDTMKRLTLDTFLLAGGFGFELNALNFEPCQLLADVHVAIWEAAVRSLQDRKRWWLRISRLWSQSARKYFDAHERLYKLWETMWQRMLEAPVPDSDKDLSLTACFRRLAASEEGAHMSRKQMEWLAGGMLLAGLDTQGLTLSFTLMCLAAHPQQQALVARELQQLGLLASRAQPEPRQLSPDDLPKLHYLDAAIKESERLMPVTGLGTARHTDRAMQIGKFWIPADTRVVIPAAIFHQDLDSWAVPDAYVPERWLPDLRPEAIAKATGQTEQLPEVLQALDKERAIRKAALSDLAAAARAKYRFSTFSHGSRSCPGYGFANMQLMVVLANLISRFEVSLAPQMGGWQGCRDKEINAFTLMLIGGNWMIFRPRDEANGAAHGSTSHAPNGPTAPEP